MLWVYGCPSSITQSGFIEVFMRIFLWRSACNILITLSLLGLTGASDPISSQDRELKIGIVQRFASLKTDKLELKATSGDDLRLKWQTNNGQKLWFPLLRLWS